MLVIWLSVLLAFALPLGACAPRTGAPGKDRHVGAALTDSHYRTEDGAELRMWIWGPGEGPRAVVVAVHGANDYGHSFAGAGSRWARAGIRTYAYDQRGHGTAEPSVRWHGHKAMAADLVAFLGLVRARHPQAPLFLLGTSIGAAIAVLAATDPQAPPLDGLILAAPAMQRTQTYPKAIRILGWLGKTVLPDLAVGRDVLASGATDNREVLHRLAEDPRIPRRIRLSLFPAMGQAMDAAARAIPRLDTRVLVLYGAQDPVISKRMIGHLLTALRGSTAATTYAEFPRGYHLLFRDRAGELPVAEVRRWMFDPPAVAVSEVHRLSVTRRVRRNDRES